MGLFLSFSGIVGSDHLSVVGALREFAAGHGGSLEQAVLPPGDDACLLIASGPRGLTALYPTDFLGWDDASAYLSQTLNTAVFSFHIHDGDLWMYQLFEAGKVVDRFNPVPDYWGPVEDEERDAWRGNPAEVARRVPGLKPDQIANYLTQWDDIPEPSPYAYPDDEFTTGQDWQILDFLRKLGLPLPLDDHGELRGTSYRFECPSQG
jgi:hypothetical protein